MSYKSKNQWKKEYEAKKKAEKKQRELEYQQKMEERKNAPKIVYVDFNQQLFDDEGESRNQATFKFDLDKSIWMEVYKSGGAHKNDFGKWIYNPEILINTLQKHNIDFEVVDSTK